MHLIQINGDLPAWCHPVLFAIGRGVQVSRGTGHAPRSNGHALTSNGNARRSNVDQTAMHKDEIMPGYCVPLIRRETLSPGHDVGAILNRNCCQRWSIWCYRSIKGPTHSTFLSTFVALVCREIRASRQQITRRPCMLQGQGGEDEGLAAQPLLPPDAATPCGDLPWT